MSVKELKEQKKFENSHLEREASVLLAMCLRAEILNSNLSKMIEHQLANVF